MSPCKYDYWTHKDKLGIESDYSSASGSDSDKEKTDDESESKDSEFMDDVNVVGGDKNNMIGNPKKPFKKCQEELTIQILQK